MTRILDSRRLHGASRQRRDAPLREAPTGPRMDSSTRRGSLRSTCFQNACESRPGPLDGFRVRTSRKRIRCRQLEALGIGLRESTSTISRSHISPR